MSGTSRALVVQALLVPGFLLLAAAGPAEDVPARLSEAQTRFAEGDYPAAAQIAGPLASDPALARADRGEAWRLYGLSLALMGLRAESEAALLEYLKIEPEAHLDPALVPPDAVVFFEDVRARHAGELRIAKPRPRRRRYWLLNFLPPWGQHQNREPVKFWLVGATEALLLGTNITTYILLRRDCRSDTNECASTERAKLLRTINLASGLVLVPVAIYGIVDGLRGYRRISRAEERTQFTVAPTGDGFVLGVTARF